MNKTSIRYITFIDIMGFSNFVIRNSHRTVERRMEIFQSIINSHEAKLKSISKDINNKEDIIRTVAFSDSVLIISSDDSRDSLESILFCSQLIITSCMLNKIPIKGAVSQGKITADFQKSVFFGEPLIDAYNLAEQLHMYGIILDEKVEKKARMMKFDLNPFCVKTKIPTKNGNITHFAINWVNWMKITYNKKAIFVLESLYEQVSGMPRKYIDNTLDFLKVCLDKN